MSDKTKCPCASVYKLGLFRWSLLTSIEIAVNINLSCAEPNGLSVLVVDRKRVRWLEGGYCSRMSAVKIVYQLMVYESLVFKRSIFNERKKLSAWDYSYDSFRSSYTINLSSHKI